MVNFKNLLDKATNPDLKEPDLEAILEIVEEIKGKNVTVKAAVKELRKKLLDPNPTVVHYTLCVLDSVMKNCASDVHVEILSHEFMGVMKDIVTTSQSGKSAVAVDKALELIGEWKSAFGEQAGYKAIHDTFLELEKEGFVIPVTEVASAAFIQKAPEWVLGDRCCMCRQEFSRLRGYFRHHCRGCGKSVCTKCSANRAALPQYGIEEPTRVCDLCYRKQDKGISGSSAPTKPSDVADANSDLPLEYLQSSLAHESQAPPTSSRGDQLRLQEDDDLQMAIAISLNEQENKQAKTSSSGPSPSPTPPHSSVPSAPPPPSTLYTSIAQEASSTAATTSSYATPSTEQETDPNLARYLDRAYWEQRREKQESGGGSGGADVAPTSADLGPQTMVLSEGGTTSPLAESVRKTVEMFIQRMQQVSAAGGSVATDPVVLSMYQNLNAMQPQLLKQIDDVQQMKAHQEQILHKINEAKVARASLNTMRRQHLEKIRQQEEEQVILGRMQMEQKLALLRQQKQEQFTYQQALQQKRLEDLYSQRSEYERQLLMQREGERQQLIAQEQQVLQQQFGRVSPVNVQYGSSPGQPHPPAQPPLHYQAAGPSLPMQGLSLQDPIQAPPLPSKLDHNPSADPTPPPPYQPASVQTDRYYQLPQSYQPTAQYQPPTSMPSEYASFQPPPSISPAVPFPPAQAPPQSGGFAGQPQMQATFHQPPPSLQVQPSYSQPQSLPPTSLASLQPSYLPAMQQPSFPPSQQPFPSMAAPQQPSYSPGTTPLQPPPQQFDYTTAAPVPYEQPYEQPAMAPYSLQAGQPVPQGSAMPPQQPIVQGIQGGLQRRESVPPLISFD